MKKEVLIYFIGKSTPAIVNLVIIILGVRFLGTEQYGKYSLILSGVILITNFSFTWIQQSMVRFLSAFKDHPAESISRFFFLTLVSALPGTLALVLSCIFYYKLSLFEVFFVVLYSLMLIFFLFRQTVYQTLIKPVKYAMYEGVYNLLLFSCFTGFVFVFAWKSYLILFISMGVSCFLAELVHQIFFIENAFRLDLSKIHWNKEFTKKAMDYGFILTIWIFLYTIITIADRYIIKEFSNYSTLGTYSAIKDLVTKISTFAILPIYMAFNARINDTWNNGDESGALKLVKQALQLELLICIVMIGGFVLFRNLVFTRILHLEGQGVLYPSIFLIAGAFLWQGALIIQKPLELLMKQRTMVVVLMAVLIVNLTFNLFFIPKFGINAAATVSFVTPLVYVAISWILSKLNLRKHHQHTNIPVESRQESLISG